MACVVKWRGKWALDYRDGGGRRHRLTFGTKTEADKARMDVERLGLQATRPAVSTNITVEDYADHWLEVVRARVKPKTYTSYELTVRLHLKPALGKVKVRQLVKGRIKALLAEKLSTPIRPETESQPARYLSRSTVRIIHATLRAMLNGAIDDGILLANPADRIGRAFRLTTSAKDRESEVKAMDRTQLASFLSKAKEKDSRHYPLFLLMARTGMRLGEAIGLKWADIDTEGREVRVERSITDGVEGTPKSGKSRRVDMSAALRDMLQKHRVACMATTLEHGWGEPPEWVFFTEAATPLDPSAVGKAFRALLKPAKLPAYFHPHCLRHSFASILLQSGVSPAYVQRQLGHSSIQLTVDTYGRWLPMENKAAVDSLDAPAEPRGDKVVTTSEPAGVLYG